MLRHCSVVAGIRFISIKTKTPMNQYTDRYKTLTTNELLRVTENQEDYQPEAVEAALHEMNRRNLTPEEVAIAKIELETELQKKHLLQEKRTENKRKLKSWATSVIDAINPIQKTAPGSEKLIRMITILFGLITLARWYSQFGFVAYLFTDDSSGWDFSIVEYLFPLILLPLATILFGLRKKSGWILMAVFLTYAAINAIGSTIITWNIRPDEMLVLESLSPPISPITYIVVTLFCAGTVGVLNKRAIREQYHITLQTAILTMSITAVLAFLLIKQYL